MAALTIPLDVLLRPELRVRHFIRHTGAMPDFAATAHDMVEVAWVESGHVRYRIGRRTYDVGPGELMMVPAHVEHHTAMSLDTTARSLWLDPGLAPAAAPGPLSAGAPVVSLGRLLHREANAGLAGRDQSIDGLLDALSVRLSAPSPREAADDLRIARAVEFIEDCYAEPIGVAEIAKAAGMSRAHFSRAFRRQTGRAPYGYVQEVRVHRAEALLASGCDVTEAALSVGYIDFSRFSRAFRERVGVLPSRVRKLSR